VLVALAIWGFDYCERAWTEIEDEERLQRERELAKPWGEVVEVPAAAKGGWGAASQGGSRDHTSHVGRTPNDEGGK
jgi:hypothetical protein